MSLPTSAPPPPTAARSLDALLSNLPRTARSTRRTISLVVLFLVAVGLIVGLSSEGGLAEVSSPSPALLMMASHGVSCKTTELEFGSLLWSALVMKACPGGVLCELSSGGSCWLSELRRSELRSASSFADDTAIASTVAGHKTRRDLCLDCTARPLRLGSAANWPFFPSGALRRELDRYRTDHSASRPRPNFFIPPGPQHSVPVSGCSNSDRTRSG